MKRFISLLLAILCIGVLPGIFAGCTTDQPDPKPAQIDIIRDGQSQYKLIRSELLPSTSDVVKAIIALRKSIKDATGVELEFDTDWVDRDATVPNDAYEILIGSTNREASSLIPADLGKDQYVIRFNGKKIVIAGGSDLATVRAIEYFTATFLGYDAAAGTYSQNCLVLPEGLNVAQSFEYPYAVYIIKGSVASSSKYDENDVVRLYSCLQGLLNKNPSEHRFYVYQDYDSQDPFWLNYISGEGKLLNGMDNVTLSSFEEFWKVFGSYVKEYGMVLWDASVPSTANVASTICSVDHALPVRYNPTANSLYTFLRGEGVEVKTNLVGMFTGEGTIPDTAFSSSGSAKCDAYLWALEKYMDKCNSKMIAYTLDGASCVEDNPIYLNSEGHNPAYNQIYSHDYLVYNECFFFDLTCTKDEAPCDDLTQPLGTDEETLKTILTTMAERNNGNMIKLMGFPPWYMKYTTFHNNSAHVEPVGLEWAFVDYISRYNCVKEADAAHPAWMTNGSVYCQYVSNKGNYVNNTPQETLDFDKKTRYFTIYMGDYDSSAWFKADVPTFFNDTARGTVPLIWGFNPNLGDRVPMVFDYVYENLTPNDYIVTGDSGAGYVFPSCVADLEKWKEFNLPYMEDYSTDIVGFIINGTYKMTPEIFKAYAEIAPVGSFHNDTSQHLVIYNNETVYMHLQNGIDPNAGKTTYDEMYYEMRNNGSNFSAFRTVVQSPTSVANCINKFIEYAEAKNDGYTYVCVDPYTLFDLVLQSGQGQKIND